MVIWSRGQRPSVHGQAARCVASAAVGAPGRACLCPRALPLACPTAARVVACPPVGPSPACFQTCQRRPSRVGDETPPLLAGRPSPARRRAVAQSSRRSALCPAPPRLPPPGPDRRHPPGESEQLPDVSPRRSRHPLQPLPSMAADDTLRPSPPPLRLSERQAGSLQ